MERTVLMLKRIATGAVIAFGLSACATIPRESVDLSIELGKRVSAIEVSHMTLLEKHFADKRNKVDEFLFREWVPDFAAQFFANPQISNLWDQVVRSNDPADRLEFIVTLGPKLQGKINQKRLELIAPLDEAERFIQQQLSANYDQARSINNSITSFLLSSSKVAENRNRYLEMLGVKDEKISAIIDQVDVAVDGLAEKAEKVAGKEVKAKEYFQKFTDLKAKLKN